MSTVRIVLRRLVVMAVVVMGALYVALAISMGEPLRSLIGLAIVVGALIGYRRVAAPSTGAEETPSSVAARQA